MIHDSDNQTRDSFVFWEGLLRGYCLHASVITPCSLVEGGGVEQCEKRRGSRESLVSGVWWWMVHAVWLRAHMNKHIRLRFAAHSKYKALIMQWDDIKKKKVSGKKCDLIMFTAPRRLGYGWIADDVLKGTVLNRGYFFSFPKWKQIEHLKWLHLTPLLHAEIF